MKQQALAMAADQSARSKRYRRPTLRDEFLATLERIMRWSEPRRASCRARRRLRRWRRR